MDEAREDVPRAEGSLRSPGRVGELGARVLDLVRLDYGLAALIGMALVGIAIAIYLTTVHYAGVAPICSTTGVVDCARVTSSQWSVVPGTQLPITVPGMLWFLVSGGLAAALLRARARGEPEDPRVRQAQLVWGALGLLTVLYLVYIEIVQLHRLCEWCTVVHLLIFGSFLIVLSRGQLPLAMSAQGSRASQRPTPRATGATGAAPDRSGSRARPAQPAATHRPAPQAPRPKRKRS